MENQTKQLPKRQEIILRAVVEHYMTRATPLGSKQLKEQQGLDCSPATIRSEMSSLEAEGYLTHPHTSSGRVPTSQGIRYYLDHLLAAVTLSDRVANQLGEELSALSSTPARLAQTISQRLSQLAHQVSLVRIAGRDHHDSSVAGLEYFLGQPEFADSLKLKDLFHVLNEEAVLDDIFCRNYVSQPVRVLVGSEELAGPYRELFNDVSIIASGYGVRSRVSGSIGIIGPQRMDYQRLIPLVRSAAEAVETALAQY